jgi:hypothetical protein
MKVSKLLLLTAMFMSLILLATPAFADTTYTYQDAALMPTTFGSPGCAPSCFLSGNFTVAHPLGDNLNGVNIAPLLTSFYFTDSVEFVQSGPGTYDPEFAVWTNGSGQITNWEIYMYVPWGATLATYNFYWSAGGYKLQTDYSFTPMLNVAQNENQPGTWKERSTATPEPSSLLLLASVLFGLSFMTRRALQR